MKPIAPKFEWRPRRLFRGLSFDGIDDYVEVPSSNALKVSSGLTLYVKGKLTIEISKQLYSRGAFAGKGLEDYVIQIEQEANRVRGKIIDSKGAPHYTLYTGDATKVHDYVLTFNGYVQKLFVDSSLVDSTSWSGEIRQSDNSLLIGSLANIHYLGLEIYTILVYSRALSDSEIKYIYNNPHNPPQDGLVLWLSPGSIDPINGKWWDLSPYGNHGTIYGATVVNEEEEVEVL
ncbi:MAG: hypothetical protein J7J61_06935 [Candidatus Hydrothermae bacterium]|nr:hypothetical protein [Candidatus Hydrothermae bacterium]